MSKTVAPTAPTAAQVRAYAQANPAKFAGLTESEQHTIGSRGRLAPAVFNTYNKGRKPEKRYVLGASGVASAANKAQRADLVSKGLAGTRGPLSKGVQASLSHKG